MEDLLPFAIAHLRELAAGIVAIVVTLLMGMGIKSLLSSRTEVIQDRLRRAVATDTEARIESEHTKPDMSLWQKMAGMITRLAQPTGEKERGHLQQKLAQAGLRQTQHLVWYLAAKVVLAVLLVLLVIWINSIRIGGIRNLPYVTILAMICGFYAPGLWLHSRLTKRKRLLNRALPDALDLLVTCVESGLGLDAAMTKVADETSLSEPLLANELRQVSAEIRVGITRGDAFRRMAWRTGVEEIQNLSAIIAQTERFGTSVAKALRVMADGMRIRRMQLAEERAATVSVKMTIPLVFFIFPSLMAAILGPAILRIYHYMIGSGGN